MAWKWPPVWQVGDVLTADRLNKEIRNNILAIKDPPTAHVLVTGQTFQTNNTAFVRVNAGTDQFKLTLPTNGGDVLIGFHGNGGYNGITAYDVRVDGTRLGGVPNGLITKDWNASFVVLATNLSAGTHNFELVWRSTDGSTVSLYTGNQAVQFWAREVS